MNRDLGLILLVIGALALSLCEIFHQLATEYFDLPTAVAVFIVVSALLILSFAFGFFALSLMVLPIAIERWRTGEAKDTK